MKHNGNSIPPAPTWDEVINLIPKDFKPGYPDTDRICSLFDAFDFAKQYITGTEKRTEIILADFQRTVELLQKVSPSGTNTEVDEWLNKFNPK